MNKRSKIKSKGFIMIVKIVCADLKRWWLGALMIILLIMTASSLSTSINLSERALREGSARAADRFDLIIGSAGSDTQLVLSSVFLQKNLLPLLSGKYLADLQNNPLVDWVAPLAFGDSYQNIPIVGTSSQAITHDGQFTLAQGRMFHDINEVVIGYQIDLKIGDKFQAMHGFIDNPSIETHRHDTLTYVVVGKMVATGSAWDSAIFSPVQAVWETHGLDSGNTHNHNHNHEHDDTHEHEHTDQYIDYSANFKWDENTPAIPAILVKPKSIAAAYQLRHKYRADLTQAAFPGEVLSKLYATLGDIRGLLSMLALATQLLVGMAITFIVVLHLGQRRRQIGGLRAFGASRRYIFSLVWVQLMILLITGLIFGLLGGYGLARFFTHYLSLESGVTLPVALTVEDVIFSIQTLVIAAIIALIPAFLSFRHSPASALRE